MPYSRVVPEPMFPCPAVLVLQHEWRCTCLCCDAPVTGYDDIYVGFSVSGEKIVGVTQNTRDAEGKYWSLWLGWRGTWATGTPSRRSYTYDSVNLAIDFRWMRGCQQLATLWWHVQAKMATGDVWLYGCCCDCCCCDLPKPFTVSVYGIVTFNIRSEFQLADVA